VARASIAAEGASDPTMFAAPERMIWASRQGEVTETTPPLPRFEVVGGFFGPMRRTDPRDSDFPDVGGLAADWTQAARTQDRQALAEIASESARRTRVHRALAADPTEGLFRDLGALGHAIAHTGAARALLFAPGTVPEGWATALRGAGFRRLVRFFAGG